MLASKHESNPLKHSTNNESSKFYNGNDSLKSAGLELVLSGNIPSGVPFLIFLEVMCILCYMLKCVWLDYNLHIILFLWFYLRPGCVTVLLRFLGIHIYSCFFLPFKIVKKVCRKP